MLARGSMEEPRFFRMIRLVHHDYPWSDEPDSAERTHSRTMESASSISRGAVHAHLPVNLAIPMRQALGGMLTNQVSKGLRLVGRLCDFEHMINDVLL